MDNLENNLKISNNVHTAHVPECQRHLPALLQTEQSDIQQWLCSHG